MLEMPAKILDCMEKTNLDYTEVVVETAATRQV
jgi:hypothetical protein